MVDYRKVVLLVDRSPLHHAQASVATGQGPDAGAYGSQGYRSYLRQKVVVMACRCPLQHALASVATGQGPDASAFGSRVGR